MNGKQNTIFLYYLGASNEACCLSDSEMRPAVVVAHALKIDFRSISRKYFNLPLSGSWAQIPVLLRF